jgi:thiol:disulfide interchange protein DsbA
MNPHRRTLIAALGLAPLAALAQPRFSFSELKPPQPVETGTKIEVIEFFWYGCIHCYSLEPLIENWSKHLAADTQFRRVPAIFNERWARDAAFFYAFEALGVLDKVHRAYFDALHRDALRTDNPAALAQWLEKQAIEPKKFDDAVKSFGVQSKVRRAAQQTVAYKIDGTPAMAVHGRYTVSADQGGSREGILQTVDYLVDMVRKRK